MKPVTWGIFGALLFVCVWTLATMTGTTMPPHFAQMHPMGLVGAGFFWGAALCMIRDKLGPKHG